MSELEVFNLAMYFRSEFMKYDKRIFTAKTVKTGKWWKFFEETISKFSEREEWNPDVFVRCQFESFGKIYPPQLPTERAWKTFINYKFKIENSLDKETKIVKNVLSGYHLVKNFCDERRISFSISNFIDDRFHRSQLEKQAYPLNLFMFSKAYGVFFEKNDTIRMLVAQVPKLMSKIKEILGEDFE